MKYLVKYMRRFSQLFGSEKAQKVFNVFMQLLVLWVACLFGYYTALSYFVSAEALDQAVLTNQISLAIFCLGMDTINSSACAPVIESTNVNSLATQVLGNSSLTSWTDATLIPTSPNGFARFNGVSFLMLYILTLFGLLILFADFMKAALAKGFSSYISKSPQLQPLQRTTTTDLESNGREPAKPGDQPHELVASNLNLPMPGLSRQSSSHQGHASAPPVDV